MAADVGDQRQMPAVELPKAGLQRGRATGASQHGGRGHQRRQQRSVRAPHKFSIASCMHALPNEEETPRVSFYAGAAGRGGEKGLAAARSDSQTAHRSGASGTKLTPRYCRVAGPLLPAFPRSLLLDAVEMRLGAQEEGVAGDGRRGHAAVVQLVEGQLVELALRRR